MATSAKATISDLYRVRQKAEIVGGEVVVMSPTGGLPSSAGGVVYFSLRQHQLRVGWGRAYPDGAGFIVDLPNRRSFSPDAAYHAATAATMKFVEGAPLFAVEVRSEEDYGPAAEKRMADKRADYFAAGTAVVWDVDLLSPDAVRAHRAGESSPRTFRRGQVADAEPALPGWRFRVDELFE
ncbi:MAG TPA: Uma2 family endonuclease [Vicinamibacteria bacterium]